MRVTSDIGHQHTSTGAHTLATSTKRPHGSRKLSSIRCVQLSRAAPRAISLCRREGISYYPLTQEPKMQASSAAHWTPQPPQLLRSDVGSTQTPSQGMNGKMHGL